MPIAEGFKGGEFILMIGCIGAAMDSVKGGDRFVRLARGQILHTFTAIAAALAA